MHAYLQYTETLCVPASLRLGVEFHYFMTCHHLQVHLSYALVTVADELPEEAEAGLGGERGVAEEESTDGGAGLGGKGGEEGAELGVEQAIGDGGDERGEGDAKDAEGEQGVVDAVADGAEDARQRGVEIAGLVQDQAGEVLELGGGEGMTVRAVGQGIEVARWGAGPARAELGVAVGAAGGVAAHGPAAAARDGAAGFARVTRHGWAHRMRDAWRVMRDAWRVMRGA
jgi:hypothetical protein